MWQITVGHLRLFLLEFCCQIWTQGTLRHILGPILVIFKYATFDNSRAISVLLRKWVLSENQSFLNERAMITPLLV